MSTEKYRDLKMPFLASSGWHTLSYREWGRARNQKVLICVHGLSRNRLDFDTIAEALSDQYRVISVDMPGRGLSDWMPSAEDYNYPFFQSLLVSLIAVTGARQVDWIGTSMGGILGMGLAGRPGSLIRRMVMNDIGPFISGEARAANAGLADAAVPFETDQDGIDFIVKTRSAFGPFSKKAAQKFGRDSLARSADGKWRVHYDPRITGDRGGAADVVMWDQWNRISIPVMTLWGTQSKILSADTVERMRATGPRAEVLPIEGVGHCPGLTTDHEIEAIREFLLR
jgi:pimeloyl-ACP methyl ester carboxylesterase